MEEREKDVESCDCDMLGTHAGISTEKLLLGGASPARGGQEAVGKQPRATFTPPQSAQCGTMHVAEMGGRREAA